MEPIVFGTGADLKKVLNGRKHFGKEDCPFCHDLRENKRVLWKGRYFALIYNLFPYVKTDRHIMLIPIEHITHSHDIPKEYFCDFQEAHTIARNFFGDENYFSFTRETFGGRSVEHIHTHFLPGKAIKRNIANMLIEQGFMPNE